MSTMNISLPEPMKKFVQQRASESDFSNPSDYIRSLIRTDKAQAELESLLLQGISSGPAQSLSDADLKQINQIISRS